MALKGALKTNTIGSRIQGGGSLNKESKGGVLMNLDGFRREDY